MCRDKVVICLVRALTITSVPGHDLGSVGPAHPTTVSLLPGYTGSHGSPRQSAIIALRQTGMETATCQVRRILSSWKSSADAVPMAAGQQTQPPGAGARLRRWLSRMVMISSWSMVSKPRTAEARAKAYLAIKPKQK